jgi:hypothetical protein
MISLPKTLCPVCQEQKAITSVIPINIEACPCPPVISKQSPVKQILRYNIITTSLFYESIINRLTKKLCPFN